MKFEIWLEGQNDKNHTAGLIAEVEADCFNDAVKKFVEERLDDPELKRIYRKIGDSHYINGSQLHDNETAARYLHG